MTRPDQADGSAAELIARAIDGEAAAVGDLYERYLQSIYRYVYYQVKDPVDAEDLTETVFLKAWEALPRARPKASTFRAWLYRIAHNAVVDRYRRRRPTVPLDHALEAQDAAPLPEQRVEREEEMARLAAVLAQLKPRYRQVILCRFISQLSHAETASVMGTSEGNVRVLQHRALAKMQQLWLEEKG